jgi:metal-responsive CopG/Arc/MetJ family transcriptional regulator
MNVRTNLLLPRDLVEEVDRIAGPRGRSRFFADAARRRLRQESGLRMVRETAGVLRAEDYPHWATSEDVVEWITDRRAEKTEPRDER